MQNQHQSQHRNQKNRPSTNLNDYLNQEYKKLVALNQQQLSSNKKLSSSNQQLSSSLDELRAQYDVLSSDNEQLLSSNQQLSSSKQQLSSLNQQLLSSNKKLSSSNQQLSSSLDELRAQYDVLRNENTVCMHNIAIYYNDKQWYENRIKLLEEIQASLQKEKIDNFSSQINFNTTQSPDSFEDCIFKLSKSDFSNDPVRLKHLQMCLGEHFSRGEYFNQFIPYIMEEVFAGIKSQLEIVKIKNLEPFEATIVSNERECSQYVTITCKTSNLPDLDHGFFKEAVLIEFDNNVSIIAIGSLKNNYKRADESEFNERDTYFSLQMPKKDYRNNIFQRKNGPKPFKLHLHWLYGLIPASRCYEVCKSKPCVNFENQFMKAELPLWSSANDDVLCDLVEGMNTAQSNIINSFMMSDPGLYLVQGPPGTGKTTTTVALLKQWVKSHPSEKILVCTASNHALHVLAERAVIAFSDYNVSIAVTGVATNISHSISNVFANNFAKRLVQPLIQLMQQVKSHLSRMLFQKICNAYDGINNTLQKLLNDPRQMEVQQNVKTRVIELASFISERFQSIFSSPPPRPQEMVDELKNTINMLQLENQTLEEFLVQRAQVVFSTLVSSGRNWLQKQINLFDLLIIDEASQATVPETLIPLRFNPTRCIHIGDPQQLSATIKSTSAKKFHYNRSLMDWLMNHNGQPFKMLTEQYRMHHTICDWPSTMYYEERLITPASVRARPCILQNNNRLPPTLKRPCVFVDVCGEERRNGDETKSISNEIEAISVVNFAYYLMESGFKSQQVGIITFYASQVERIKSNLSRIAHRRNISVPNIVVSTVDGFQGDECDITLISMVRTCTSVGFLNTPERINVAMTRAKYGRFVFGNSATLALSNSDVSHFLDSCLTKITLEELNSPAFNLLW